MARKFVRGQERLGAWKVYPKFFVYVVVRPLWPNSTVGGQKNHFFILTACSFIGKMSLKIPDILEKLRICTSC